jgi:hypothetical protein
MLSLLRVELDETGLYDGKAKPLCANALGDGA